MRLFGKEHLFNMKIKKMLSLLLCSALLIPSCSVAASAQETDTQKKTYTYYFLAPDNWFDTSLGAVNGDIGCYWQNSDVPEETIQWPGTKMTPAFDIGENIFKITGVPADATTVCFNSYLDEDYVVDTDVKLSDPQVAYVNICGYGEDDAKEIYDGCPVTDNFDGFIYVINPYEGSQYSELSMATQYFGAWFKLDEYKNYPEYYGSYNIEKKKTGCTYYLAAPDNWFKAEKGAENSDVGAVLYSDYTDNGDKNSEHIVEKMTPAPEIGDNIFKLENVPYKYTYIQFYDYTDIKPHRVNGEAVYPSDAVLTRGYNICKMLSIYDYENDYEKRSSFDGMVYVFDMDYSHEYSRYGDSMVQGGAWFTANSYKDYESYYGSYKKHDSDEHKEGTFTYYFLAPESWCGNSKEPGKNGIVIGSKSEDGSEGTYLLRAPEIGENVYAAKGVSPTRNNIRFASWEGEEMGACTRIISTKGYDGNCPYDESVKTENFDGWIYVLDGTTDSIGDSFGAWFTVEDYRKHADYYGIYGVDGETPDEPADIHKDQRFTLYFLAPDSWVKKDAGALNDKVGCVIEETKIKLTNEEYPGAEMTPAFDIGENVFKITGLLPDTFTLYFTNYTLQYDEQKECRPITVRPNSDGSCPYNGMIYVLDCTSARRYATGLIDNYGGEWFDLDDYKNNNAYYKYIHICGGRCRKGYSVFCRP